MRPTRQLTITVQPVKGSNGWEAHGLTTEPLDAFERQTHGEGTVKLKSLHPTGLAATQGELRVGDVVLAAELEGRAISRQRGDLPLSAQRPQKSRLNVAPTPLRRQRIVATLASVVARSRLQKPQAAPRQL